MPHQDIDIAHKLSSCEYQIEISPLYNAQECYLFSKSRTDVSSRRAELTPLLDAVYPEPIKDVNFEDMSTFKSELRNVLRTSNSYRTHEVDNTERTIEHEVATERVRTIREDVFTL